MPEMIEAARRPSVSRRRGCGLHSVRPSLLDLRFTGDPWVVGGRDDVASLRLADYMLARIRACPFDLPHLNNLLHALRLWQARRAAYARWRRA
jgi:hypothetical protein